MAPIIFWVRRRGQGFGLREKNCSTARCFAGLLRSAILFSALALILMGDWCGEDITDTKS